MNDTEFYKEIDKIFESYLEAKTGKLALKLKQKSTNKILNVDYSQIRFDSELNYYKKAADGSWAKVDNPDFEVIVVQKTAAV